VNTSQGLIYFISKRYRTLEHEYDGTNAVYEEELAAKDHLTRQCQKAEAEANLWRLRVK